MEEKETEIALRIKKLKQALTTLEEAIKEPYTEFVRDAIIQRFEYTFELSWKLLKKVSLFEGIECVSPRQAIRNALDLSLINDLPVWNKFLEYRNNTSHTYNQLLAQEVYEYAKQFPTYVHEIIYKIEIKQNKIEDSSQ